MKKIIFVISFIVLSGFLFGLSAPDAKAATVAELQAQIAELLAQINDLRGRLADLTGTSSITDIPTACTGITFTRNLSQGSSGTDVKCLQALLNTDVATQVAISGAGSKSNETNFFGFLTRAAVIKFQEKYRAEILIPARLTRGTGFAGPSTRKKLSTLLEKGYDRGDVLSLTITAPKENEQIGAGEYYNIEWKVSGAREGQFIYIYRRLPNEKWKVIHPERLSHDISSFPWQVPSVNDSTDVILYVGLWDVNSRSWVVSERLSVKITPSSFSTPGRCVRTDPTITINPESFINKAGSYKGYGVFIKNNDSSECDSSVFDLSRACPAQWDCKLTVQSMTISPGQSRGTTLGVTSPGTASHGTYELAVTAVNRAAKQYGKTGKVAYIVEEEITCPDWSCSYIITNYLETLQKFDQDGNGGINMSEFLAAVNDWQYGDTTQNQMCAVQNAWQKGCEFTTVLLSPCDNYGDVNEDGHIDDDDIEAIKDCIFERAICTAERRLRADVNNDEKVDAGDITALERYIAGLDSTLAACSKTSPCDNYGDLTGNGFVNLRDVELVKDCIFEKPSCTVEHRFRADVNNDEKVDAGDITALKRYIAGLDSTLAACSKTSPCDNYGDLTGSGFVNLRDVELVKDCIFEKPSCTVEHRFRADVNNDDLVNSGDITQLKRYIAGLDSTFPVCQSGVGFKYMENQLASLNNILSQLIDSLTSLIRR